MPDHDTTGFGIVQLRASEGNRMRQAYEQTANRYRLRCTGRSARWQGINSWKDAITETTQCLYGAAAAILLGLGCSPALGLIHTGHALSFVFDAADLRKVSVAVDEACRAISAGTYASSTLRRAMDL